MRLFQLAGPGVSCFRDRSYSSGTGGIGSFDTPFGIRLCFRQVIQTSYFGSTF